jgi:hypothetical protein
MRGLMLFEQSAMEMPANELPLLRGRLFGDMKEIRCTICGRLRDWSIGEDALNELLERRCRE